jgi:hypothetical protein
MIEEIRRARIWKDPRSLPSTKMTKVMHCLSSPYQSQYLPDSLISSVIAANLSDDLFKPTMIIARVNTVAGTIIIEKVLAIIF